jgi:hypothetical protein
MQLAKPDPDVPDVLRGDCAPAPGIEQLDYVDSWKPKG